MYNNSLFYSFLMILYCLRWHEINQQTISINFCHSREQLIVSLSELGEHHKIYSLHSSFYSTFFLHILILVLYHQNILLLFTDHLLHQPLVFLTNFSPFSNNFKIHANDSDINNSSKRQFLRLQVF